jgi:serine-type D-Ala-D-Ala carboxypeptidase/endopeptidase (penicillin-binding protein 4)
MKLLFIFFLQISSPFQKIVVYLDSLQNDYDLRTGTIAASIRSTQTGEYKLQYNSHKSLNSASVLKLVSTATALSVLSPNYKYQTFLEYDGTIIDGVLQGNIYIRGSGDPSLGSSRVGLDFKQVMNQFALKIKELGILRIDGNILGDATVYSENTVADTWIWGDMGNYYGAGVSGLNINENLYSAVFKTGTYYGEFAPILRFNPELPNLFYQNKVSNAEKGSGDNVMIYAAPFTNQLMMEGTVPMNSGEFSVKGSIPDPAYFAAFHLQKKIAELGIETTNPTQPYKIFKEKNAYLPKQRYLISIQESPTLAILTQHCNYQSINLFADAFLKSVGYALSKDANFEPSIKALKSYWTQRSIDLQGFMIKDGSGLSPSGVLTTNNLTDILYAMKYDYAFNDFYASIPIVGINGTVQNLCKGTKAVGNVRAKSGSISNTRAYSGYYTTSNGELMAFTFIINRYNDGAERKVRKILENMMIMMIE